MTTEYKREITGMPREFGVPHDEWRHSQAEALGDTLGILDAIKSGNKELAIHTLLQLPTGSGKSGIACAVGKEYKLLVVVHTLALLDQYEREYGFSIIKGKQEYTCTHPVKSVAFHQDHGEIMTASDCHLEKMPDCEYAGQCPYLQARIRVSLSQRSACTYRYASLSRMIIDRAGVVFCDEADSAPDELLGMAEIEVNQRHVDKYGLPDLPFPAGFGEEKRGGVMVEIIEEYILKWFGKAIKATLANHSDDAFLTPEDIRKMKFHNSLKMNYGRIVNNPYFLETGKISRIRVKEGRGWVEKIVPGMILKALDASQTAHKLWENKRAAFLMSATIGNPEPLARELGIESYQFYDYPHPVPIEKRPVYTVNIARMTKYNLDKHPKLYEIQAKRIHEVLQWLPQEWRGIILTSSYAKRKILVDHLMKWYSDRIFDPYQKIERRDRVDHFMRDATPGAIAVELIQGWGHGLSFYGELARFSIIAGVPFKNPFEPYTIARKQRPGGGEYYFYSAYRAVPQGGGRVGRGAMNGDGEYLLNVVVLVDGCATTKKSLEFYPECFTDAMIPWEER